MQTRALGKTGLQVTRAGFGCAPLGGMFGALDEAGGVAAVRHAIDRGINLVDTSPYYGETRSETLLGKALAGGYRERVILSSKAGRDGLDRFDFSPAHITESVEASLRRLGTDHLDILIAHDIEFAVDFDQVFTETNDTLQRLKREGKARFVGMSGLPLTLLAECVQFLGLDVVITYAHANILNGRALTQLLPLAEKHGVGVINASPLSMGLLTQAGPQPWHPADDETKAACRRAAEVCARRGADLAHLTLQVVLNDERLTTTLLGPRTIAEIDSALSALDTTPDADLLAEVTAALAPVRDGMWPSGNWHTG